MWADNKSSFSVCLLGWVISVCMNGLAVVEALWRHTGITGIIKHAMGASYEEISCIPIPPALGM